MCSPAPPPTEQPAARDGDVWRSALCALTSSGRAPARHKPYLLGGWRLLSTLVDLQMDLDALAQRAETVWGSALLFPEKPVAAACRSGGTCLQARGQQAFKAARLHRGGRLRDEVALQRRQHRRAHAHMHTLHCPPGRWRHSTTISPYSVPAVQLPVQQACMHIDAAQNNILICMQSADDRRAVNLLVQLSMLSSPRRLTSGRVYTAARHA